MLAIAQVSHSIDYSSGTGLIQRVEKVTPCGLRGDGAVELLTDLTRGPPGAHALRGQPHGAAMEIIAARVGPSSLGRPTRTYGTVRGCSYGWRMRSSPRCRTATVPARLSGLGKVARSLTAFMAAAAD